MNTIANALAQTGQFILTDHARERIRQRVGIVADSAAIAWVAEQVRRATETKRDGSKTHYTTDLFEIILDGAKVVTVKPSEHSNGYISKFNEVLTKEATKLLATYRRELHKAEIAVAEAQLNFLKARNPKVKATIQRRLTDAADYKATIEDEIKAVEKAAARYGVTVQ